MTTALHALTPYRPPAVPRWSTHQPVRALVCALLAAAAAGWHGPSPAAGGDAAAWAEMQQADLAQGRQLIAQHRCSECHARRVGGDGSAIYRPAGRISRPAALLAMVEMCNTELNLQLFPDDVAAIAAALNQQHYRFTPAAKP